MLFNSFIFIFAFLPVVWVLHRIASQLRQFKIAIAVLSLSSLVFYGYWNPAYLALILFSVVFNFCYAKLILKKNNSRRWALIIGICINLGILCFFKYTNFILDNLGHLSGKNWHIDNLILPLGISFFTFQQISYLVDYYKGIVKEHSFLNYCLFVCFFPQLIAGPIVHHDEMMPQFRKAETFVFNPHNVNVGLTTFVLGLFKKVVIADTLSPYAISLFDGSGSVDISAAWLGSLCYTMQIYFDFSGYSDMAIGLGKLFNIDIPINFNSPYKSQNITQFWRSWHITLSKFLKDYLYIPLGGNRKGTGRRYVNLMITMLLGGLWHGAGWMFIIWGALHGLYLCIHQGWRKISERLGVRVPGVVSWTITFLAVHFAWIIFRAPSLERALTIYKGMFAIDGLSSWHIIDEKFSETLFPFAFDDRIILLVASFLIALLLPPSWQFARKPDSGSMGWVVPIGAGAMFVFSVLCLSKVSEFLYFQF